MIVSRTLKLTDRYEPNSKKVGDLEDGTRVMLVDVIEDGGAHRGHVIVSEGTLKGKEGWVTMETKQGTKLLIDEKGIEAFVRLLPKATRDAAYAAFKSIDVDNSKSLSAAELKEVLQPEGSGGDMSEAELEKIVKTFDVNGDGEIDINEFAVMFAPTFDPDVDKEDEPKGDTAEPAASGPGGPKKPLTKQLSRSWKLKRSATSNKLTALMSESFAKKAKAARGKFSFKKKGIFGTLFGGEKKGEKAKSALGATGKGAGKAKSGDSMMTTLALTGLKRDVLERAETLEAASADTGSLQAVLGAKLAEDKDLKVCGSAPGAHSNLLIPTCSREELHASRATEQACDQGACQGAGACPLLPC